MSFKKKIQNYRVDYAYCCNRIFCVCYHTSNSKFPLEQYHNIFHLCRLHFNHGAAVCSSLQKGKINAAANEYTKWNNVFLGNTKVNWGKRYRTWTMVYIRFLRSICAKI